MHAAGSHQEIVPYVVTRLSQNFGRQFRVYPGLQPVEVDPVEPEWQPLPHMPDDDLQPGKLIKEAAINQTHRMKGCFSSEPEGRSGKRKAIIRIGFQNGWRRQSGM